MNKTVVTRRDPAAKAAKLRRGGIVPCAVYGGRFKESLSCQMDREEARRLFHGRHEGSLVELELDGSAFKALVKEIEYRAVGDEVLHLSFQALKSDAPVNAKALIKLLNRDIINGVVEQVIYEVEYSALPEDLIDCAVIDLAALSLGEAVTVGDIPEFQREGVTHITAPELVALKTGYKKQAGPRDD